MKPVAYSVAEQSSIEAATKSIPKTDWSGLWGADAVADVKSAAKKHYLDQQSHTCCYCRQQFKVDHGFTWAVEHILCRKFHPQFTFEPRNLAICCHDCNGQKREKNVYAGKDSPARYPSNGAAFTIPHPHFDNYDEHVEISLNSLYIPISPKGANLIVVCGLWRFSKMLLDIDPDPHTIVFDKILDKCTDAKTIGEKTVAVLEVGIMLQRAFDKI